jgi:hypothetical protein
LFFHFGNSLHRVYFFLTYRDQISKLSKKIGLLCTKLQGQDAQARAVAATSHLFRSQVTKDEEGEEFRDPSFLITCLKKSFSLAGECPDTEKMVTLIIESLDEFLYFYPLYPETVEVKHVTIVINKIKQLFQAKNPEKDQLQYVKNLKAFISYKQVPKNIAKGMAPFYLLTFSFSFFLYLRNFLFITDLQASWRALSKSTTRTTHCRQ